MSDPKVETVRSLISNFRRTRRTRSEPFPSRIRSEVIGLINASRNIPQLSEQLGISNVLIYQWQKNARKGKANPDHDPFIELPIEALIENSNASVQATAKGVVEIRRDDLSAVMRIECSTESIAVVMREFLWRTSAC